MSQTAPYPEEELTVQRERQTGKQIMQCRVTRAPREIRQAARRRRGLTGGWVGGAGDGGEAVPVSNPPILYSLLWG